MRVGGQREWADFPLQAEAPRLVVRFQSERNTGEWTMRLRQQDVRQTWKVTLNGKELGRLPPDENDMVVFFPIPVGQVVAGGYKICGAKIELADAKPGIKWADGAVSWNPRLFKS